MDYVVLDASWVNPLDRNIKLDNAQYVRDQDTGEIRTNSLSVDLTYTSLESGLKTVSFAATDYDERKYGRDIHEAIVDGLIPIMDAEAWEKPVAFVDPKDKQIADLEARLAAIEAR
jgi:hypothetical protein